MLSTVMGLCRRRLPWFWRGVGALFLGGVLAGCSGAKGKEGDAKKNQEPAAVPVEVEAVRRGPIEEGLQTFATLEAEQEVKVFSRTANRVVELLVEEGDEVEKDQVLLRLDDANQQTLVAKAENTLAKSRLEFERLEALYTQKLISDQAYADAKFEVRSLELALSEARRELEFTIVRAPIRGTIAQRLVRLGDLVTPNQHLFNLVDFDSIVARIYVPEKNLPAMALDQPARVIATALGDREFEGRVLRIAPTVDARSGTVKVTLGFADTRLLRPGMYVDVQLILAQKTNALLLSKRALVLDGDQRYAFRVGDDRKAERVLVEPKVTDRFHVEPASGFQEGDRVVVAGQTGLKNGARVRLPEDPDPEAEKPPGDGEAEGSLQAAR